MCLHGQRRPPPARRAAHRAFVVPGLGEHLITVGADGVLANLVRVRARVRVRVRVRARLG